MGMPEIKHQNVQYVASDNMHFQWQEKSDLPLTIQLLEQGRVVTEIEINRQEARVLMFLLKERFDQ